MSNVILIGVDGSSASLLAVDWAVREAAQRGCAVRLIHGCPLPAVRDSFLRNPTAECYYHQLLAEARNRALAADARIHVEREVTFGSPAQALTRPRPDIDRVVVGLRGRGGFPGLRIGSVAYQVAAHAAVPVTVVGPEEWADRDGRPVVVGVDGSQRGEAALAEAFDAAALYTVGLVALHAERLPMDPMVGVPPTDMVTGDPLRPERDRLVATALEPWRRKYPDVPVSTEIAWDDAVHALSAASREARLVVLGARGRRGLPLLALGSVPHGVLHHASCPVTIVHG